MYADKCPGGKCLEGKMSWEWKYGSRDRKSAAAEVALLSDEATDVTASCSGIREPAAHVTFIPIHRSNYSNLSNCIDRLIYRNWLGILLHLRLRENDNERLFEVTEHHRRQIRKDEGESVPQDYFYLTDKAHHYFLWTFAASCWPHPRTC